MVKMELTYNKYTAPKADNFNKSEAEQMRSKYSVKLKTIAKEHDLTPLHLSKDYDEAVITTADVNRPAMQLTGFYNYFDPKRLQIIGRVESTYLDTLTHE